MRVLKDNIIDSKDDPASLASMLLRVLSASVTVADDRVIDDD